MSSAPKVLVIDDDPTTQRIMRLFLEKSGFEPIVAVNGKEGLDKALAEGAPGIITLDWMLPDMDGPTVCKKLREAKPKIRPYVIFLSSKQDKNDISLALDAGADDYVLKPFNMIEFQARLRVARRTFDYQWELLKQIEANETLSQRNSLLGELITKGQAPVEPAKPAKKAAEPEIEAPVAKFTVNELKFTMAASFLEARLALEAFQPDSDGLTLESNTCLAWCGLAVIKPKAWFDVVLSVAPQEVGPLLQKSLGREAKSEREALDFLAELARIVSAGFGRMIRGRHGESRSLLMSRGLDVKQRGTLFPVISDGESFRVTVEGISFRLLTCRTAASRKMVPNAALRPLDILAASYPPPEVSAVPLFKEGVVLSPRFLEKLRYQVEATQLGADADVWRPSAVASFFNHDL